MRKTFKYRLYPNKAQERIILATLEHCRLLYNRLLGERKEAYEKEKHTLSAYTQINSFPIRKEAIPALKTVHSQVLQDVAKRLDKAFQAFFRRVKSGAKPGYPRFQPIQRYHSFTYPQTGWQVTGRTVKLSKIGDVRMKLHRAIEGTIKTATVIAKNGRYYLAFACEITTGDITVNTLPPVGIDLGIKHLAITSDGEFFETPQYLRKSERQLKRLQRQVARRQKGSTRRKKAVRQLARGHEHIANQRADNAHKVSRSLVSRYSRIAFEDLKIVNMTQNHHLAKSITDAGWNRLVQCTTYKAESAGGRVVLVDPYNTTQECSKCHALVHKELKDRVHHCPQCGYVQDRDINAAENILARAV
jgi:putative transposase